MELGVTRSVPNAHARRQARYRKNHPRKIVGADGEGMDVLGRHVYTLLRVGEDYIENKSGLSTRRCLDFLCDLDPRNRYVAFAFSYDVTMILRDVNEYKLTRLVNRELRKRSNGFGYMPVDWQDEYEFDWLPGREFRCRRKGGKWVVINDVWGFFQGKFCTNDMENKGALEKWDIGTPELRKRIADGKAMRGAFQYVDDETVKAYNYDEIVALEELVTKFVETCEAVGYMPRKLQGAGQLAEAVLVRHGVPDVKDLAETAERDSAVWDMCRKAYYGGRFETGYTGVIDEPVYQYDINSAYIDAMIDPRYPCLLHGTWKRVPPGTPVESLSDIAVLKVGYALRPTDADDWQYYKRNCDIPDDGLKRKGPHYAGVPYRDKHGFISYRYQGIGWYWSFEIEASIHQHFYVMEGWEYERNCDCHPMGFMGDIYLERVRIGKDGKGQVLKTGMASVYGKKVQSIGSPRFSNPVEGSFITAHCREKIQLLLHSLPSCKRGHCGESVAFIATDAIASTEKPEVEISDRLGAFSEEVHETGIFMVQPGLYFGSKGGRSMKTRGVAVSLIWDKRDEFLRALRKLMEYEDEFAMGSFIPSMYPQCQVHLLDQRLVGIRLAIAQNKLHMLGQWPKEYRNISFNWISKRSSGRIVGNDLIKTFPHHDAGQTFPYDKAMGMTEEMQQARDFLDDEPDWSRRIERVE